MNGSKPERKHAIVLHSGGMDSSALLYLIASTGYKAVTTVSVNYGQRHVKEIEAAAAVLGAARADFVFTNFDSVSIDLAAVGKLLTGSALTSPDTVEVPEGHYAEETMKATVVPNRNMILLAVAGGIAVARGASRVFTAVHAGDHFIYPDCRPEFIAHLSQAMAAGTEGFGDVSIGAPFLHRTKAQIASEGQGLGVPFELTWSCYIGGETHCGRCGTCVERIESFHEAGVNDRTLYADPDYWRTVTAPAAD